MSDIRVKIQKLLELASSPNEHEAKAAMLKAKELMMKHNLESMELEGIDFSKKEVVTYKTGIVCSNKVEPWIITLSNLIAKNYRCEAFFTHKHRAKQKKIAFLGFEDDVEVCGIMFKYALQCIWDKFPEIRNKMKEYGYTIADCRPLTDSYAVGFIKGMREAFDSQLKSNESEWGLVALVPQEVVAEANKINRVSIRTTPNRVVMSMYSEGIENGKKWTPESKLSTTEVSQYEEAE